MQNDDDENPGNTLTPDSQVYFFCKLLSYFNQIDLIFDFEFLLFSTLHNIE